MMISFACKGIEFEELIRCSFTLNKTEYKLLMHMMTLEKEATIPELAEKMSMDRSSMQKGITGLLNKNLATRRQVNLEKGGYFFYYSALNKEAIKKSMLKIIDNWQIAVKKEIEGW